MSEIQLDCVMFELSLLLVLIEDAHADVAMAARMVFLGPLTGELFETNVAAEPQAPIVLTFDTGVVTFSVKLLARDHIEDLTHLTGEISMLGVTPAGQQYRRDQPEVAAELCVISSSTNSIEHGSGEDVSVRDEDKLDGHNGVSDKDG